MQQDYSTWNLSNKAKILLIYTGGTIGMRQNPISGALEPFNFEEILTEVPELKKVIHTLETFSFDPPIDSSDIAPSLWQEIASLIEEQYDNYDGFVILHGTDTMSYTASALSFMLENLQKPVVFTGSQLPVGLLRTDGKENLISAIEVAAAKNEKGEAMVPEVTIFFGDNLYRGNRTTKDSAEHFNAFRSPNYPALAEAGIEIRYNRAYIREREDEKLPLIVKKELSSQVAHITLFPGICEEVIRATLESKGVRAVIIETFGTGNASTQKWFLSLLKEAIERGVIILNITQCATGSVNMEAYSTGIELKGMGVISGFDSTFEAAIAKLFFLLGNYSNNESVKKLLIDNLRGEISIN